MPINIVQVKARKRRGGILVATIFVIPPYRAVRKLFFCLFLNKSEKSWEVIRNSACITINSEDVNITYSNRHFSSMKCFQTHTFSSVTKHIRSKPNKLPNQFKFANQLTRWRHYNHDSGHIVTVHGIVYYDKWTM